MALSPQARPEDDRGFFERTVDDFGMAFTKPFSSRDDRSKAMAEKGYDPTDVSRYFARTANTMNANRLAGDSGGGGGDGGNSMSEPMLPTPEELGPRINNPAQQYRQALANRYGDAGGFINALNVSAPAGGVQPAGPEMTPGMFNSALNVFESQRGAGPTPYQMMPYGLGSFQPQMQPGQYVSPAFQYAAQNYDRLGGAQRLMPRSMPMLSMAERQKVNDMARNMQDIRQQDMARNMAEQEANRAAENKAFNEFSYMNNAFSGNFGGKGAGENKKQDIRQQLAPLLASFQKFGF
jgi:hypothetical protein